MALSKYVSAEWVQPSWPGMTAVIKAVGDDGFEYWIPDAGTDVPPWPAFLQSEEGKVFMAATEEPPPEEPPPEEPEAA